MFLNKVVSIDNDFPIGCASFYRIWSPWNQQSLLKKSAALLAKSAPTHNLNWTNKYLTFDVWSYLAFSFGSMYTQAMEPFDFLLFVSGAFQEIFTLPRSVFFSGLPKTLFWWLAVVEIPVQITCSDSTKQIHCVSLDL